MPCFRPVTAYAPLDGGAITFFERKDCRTIQVSCGQCIGCRIKRREAWAVRCLMESKMHSRNAFVTLTYDDEHFPRDGSLCYRDFQLFMKRLRKSHGKVRFFVAGEYGDKSRRPHWHALLFGCSFDDSEPISVRTGEDALYTSPELGKLWPFGFHRLGEVTLASARYCAAYIFKKVTGDAADEHYSVVSPETGELSWLQPEMCRMSLKPGIGASWIEKYWPDVYASGAGGVVVNGSVVRVPKYFDQMLDRIKPVLCDDVLYDRFVSATVTHAKDMTPERLAVREEVVERRASFFRNARGSGNEI